MVAAQPPPPVAVTVPLQAAVTAARSPTGPHGCGDRQDKDEGEEEEKAVVPEQVEPADGEDTHEVEPDEEKKEVTVVAASRSKRPRDSEEDGRVDLSNACDICGHALKDLVYQGKICLHTICRACMQEPATRKAAVCPVCRAPFQGSDLRISRHTAPLSRSFSSSSFSSAKSRRRRDGYDDNDKDDNNVRDVVHVSGFAPPHSPHSRHTERRVVDAKGIVERSTIAPPAMPLVPLRVRPSSNPLAQPSVELLVPYEIPAGTVLPMALFVQLGIRPTK